MRPLRFLVLVLLAVPLAFGTACTLDGNWRLRYETEAGVVETSSTFKTKGKTLLLVAGGEETSIGTFEDGAIEFVIPNGLSDVGFSADLVVTAKLDHGKLRGYYEYLDYAGEMSGTREAE